MKIRWRNRAAKKPGLTGPARVERDLPELSERKKRGEIVVLDMRDLDRITAERLVEREVLAVINAAASISGRYPNLGPQILANAGVMLLDFVGPHIMHVVSDGDQLRIDGPNIYREDELLATGAVLDSTYVKRLLNDAKDGVSTQVQNAAANAAELLRSEQALFLEDVGIPRLATAIKDNPVIVVDRAYDYEADLANLKRFIKRNEPVIIGAGAGADAVLDAGLSLDVVIGQTPTLSQRALREASEVVFVGSGQTSADQAKLEKAGKDAQHIRPAAAEGDLAILLAAANQASVIITVGSHTSLVEFLDRSQNEMAGTLLTQLKVAGKLVDAKTVSALSLRSSNWLSTAALLFSGVIAVVAAVATTATGEQWGSQIATFMQQTGSWIRSL